MVRPVGLLHPPCHWATRDQGVMNRSEPQGDDIGGDTFDMDTPSLLQRVLFRYTLEIFTWILYWILKTEGLEKGISCVLVRHKCWSTAPVDLIPAG